MTDADRRRKQRDAEKWNPTCPECHIDADAILALLAEHEYPADYDGDLVCPECGGWRPLEPERPLGNYRGHDHDCAWAAAMTALGGNPRVRPAPEPEPEGPTADPATWPKTADLATWPSTTMTSFVFPEPPPPRPSSEDKSPGSTPNAT